MPNCSVPHCDNPVAYTTGRLCRQCYNGMRYWLNKTPTEILKRQRQLAKLEARMEMLSPNRRKR